jgi:hypothetical protein
MMAMTRRVVIGKVARLIGFFSLFFFVYTDMYGFLE